MACSLQSLPEPVWHLLQPRLHFSESSSSHSDLKSKRVPALMSSQRPPVSAREPCSRSLGQIPMVGSFDHPQEQTLLGALVSCGRKVVLSRPRVLLCAVVNSPQSC